MTTENDIKPGTSDTRSTRDRPPGLRIVRRADTGTLQIVGTVAGHRIRRRPRSKLLRLAEQECRALEASLLGFPRKIEGQMMKRFTALEKRVGKIELQLQKIIERLPK